MAFEFCWEHKQCTRECRVRDLQVLGCTFTGNEYGVSAEEIRDSRIEGNSFTGTGWGFSVYKAYAGAGQTLSNVTVIGNTFGNRGRIYCAPRGAIRSPSAA